MSANGWLQFGIFSVVLLLCTRPVGIYLARVLEGQRTWLDPVLRPIERLTYKLCGVNANYEMNWREYAFAMLGFSAVTLVLTYIVERAQAVLPWNPQHLPGVGADLAWNTAASFTTNTNWQFYTPESTMSYLTEMAGLATHNFFSAAVGIVVAIALVRAIKRTQSGTIGNFWVDTTRTLLYILLPGSLIYALLLVAQGVPQNLHAYTVAHTLEGQTQTIAQGPVASQEAIKMLGTNGGGFFNANSSHPFENPTPFSNFLQIFSIFVIPAGLTYTLGRMTGSPGHGWAVFAAMYVLFAAGFTTLYWAESHPHPLIHGAAQKLTATAPGGNMEGKEVRNGIAESALFATVTTDASCGAVNGMHDSFTPLGGMVPLVNIMIGEVIFGGVGAGLYGMIVFIIISVFIAGLMVGRTPEYLGKKIEAYDVKMAMLVVLIFCLIVLGLTGFAVVKPYGTSSISNAGPHGLTQILYAYTSQAG
ncbi:MAG TPA: potassium-transporting ATPase subunit KdpA, partial [Terracidiphilus sp.]